MKKTILFTLILFLTSLACNAPVRKDNCMGIKFSGSGTEYIKWTTPTNAIGLVSKTIVINKYVHTGQQADTAILWTVNDGVTTDADEYNLISVLPTGTVNFLAHFSTTNGIWRTNTTLTVGQTYSIIVTYNGASTSNNPVIYINGVSQAITETSTPAGTYRSGTNTDLYIGTQLADLNPDGTIADFRIYNTIKTAVQVANIANENIETNATIDESNLVFHAPLVMCKELTYSTFVGSTLGASNEFLDRMNGYVGVPTGDPIGA